MTAGQRYHCIAGWAPWVADGLNLISAALVWKRARRRAFGEALSAAREEACLMLVLWFAALAVSRIPSFEGDLTGLVGSPDLSIWVAVLLIPSIPYAAAVFVSLVSTLNLSGAWLGEAGAAPAASEPEVETEEGLALEKRAA